jgi:hypothetical protein
MISKIESQHSIPTLKSFLKYMRGLELDWAFIIRKKTPEKGVFCCDFCLAKIANLLYLILRVTFYEQI